MEKLTGVGAGKGVSGDMVLAHQEINKTFKHVSQKWIDKCKPISEAIAKLEESKKHREDLTVDISNVVFEADGKKLHIVHEGKKLNPTEHALKQVCSKMNGVPLSNVDHLWKGDATDVQLLATLLMNGRRHLRGEKKFLMRTYDDGTVRSFMSDRYAIIDNSWYLDVLQRALPGAYISHWRGDDDTIFGNVLIPDTIREESDSEYGAMLSVRNSEIGTSRLSQVPSVFRAICMNGCIHQQVKGENINKRHLGDIDLKMMEKVIFDNINEQVPLANDIITKFLSTRQLEIGRSLMPRMFMTVAQKFDIRKDDAAASLLRWNRMESEHNNLFGLINGITRYSQELDNDSWVKLDTVAGRIAAINTNTFESYVAQANSYTQNDVAEFFAVGKA